VSKRPVFHPELAAFFRGLRVARGLGFNQAVDTARRRGLPVTTQHLRGLEKGTTKNPDPDVLRALARLYDLSYEALATQYVRVRFGLQVAAGQPDESPRDRAEAEHGGSARGRDSGENTADLILPSSRHGEALVAATRAALEQLRAKHVDALADLVTILEGLPGGQAAVARAARSGGAARNRRARRRSDRPRLSPATKRR
jgi:hypothetical protein